MELNLSLVPADKLLLRCTDAAGNVRQVRPELTLNLETDKPVVQIQLPAAGELLRDDFVISGMVFDDDQVAAIRWRLDGGEFRDLEPGNAFSVPVKLAEVGDNEHTVEVQAEDVGGLRSEIARTTFMASTSDPVSALSSPGIAEQVRGVVELAGTSKDPNGIAEVRLSFDNGLSYYLASGHRGLALPAGHPPPGRRDARGAGPGQRFHRGGRALYHDHQHRQPCAGAGPGYAPRRSGVHGELCAWTGGRWTTSRSLRSRFPSRPWPLPRGRGAARWRCP